MMKKNELKTLSDLAESMHRLAEGLETMAVYLLSSDGETVGAGAKNQYPETMEEPKIKLEEVRAVLAAKSAEGHTAEVRNLLSGFGARKLSDVKPADYETLKAKAEAL
jgi:hypothetical protein